MKKLNINEIFETEVRQTKQKIKKREARREALERREDKANEKRLIKEESLAAQCEKLEREVTIKFNEIAKRHKEIKDGIMYCLRENHVRIWRANSTRMGMVLWKNSVGSQAILIGSVKDSLWPTFLDGKNYRKVVFYAAIFKKAVIPFGGVGKAWILDDQPSKTVIKELAKLINEEHLARSIARQVAQIK